MKKKVIVFRFGMPEVTIGDMEAVRRITDGLMDAAYCPSPFGIVSMFYTDLSPAEVTDIYKQAAQAVEDILPMIAFEEGAHVGYDFNPVLFEHFDLCNQAFEERFGIVRKECVLSLDELLDLVKEKGVKGLTEEELTRLKELSK